MCSSCSLLMKLPCWSGHIPTHSLGFRRHQLCMLLSKACPADLAALHVLLCDLLVRLSPRRADCLPMMPCPCCWPPGQKLCMASPAPAAPCGLATAAVSVATAAVSMSCSLHWDRTQGSARPGITPSHNSLTRLCRCGVRRAAAPAADPGPVAGRRGADLLWAAPLGGPHLGWQVSAAGTEACSPT